MQARTRPLHEQVIVITGATSGIGLCTARMAARRGARVILAARNEQALRDITREINGDGGRAVYVVADVSREDDVRRIGEAAVHHFGRIDTWHNNAAVSIYGQLIEIPIAEQRQLFEINYWGIVYGSRVAVEHMRHEGGTLINMGSVLSDRAIPRQGAYCASKAAIKNFTDALRMELEEDGLPINVTLIKPSAIDTPYTKHAKNYMPYEPRNPPPVYHPHIVARAVLHCAERPRRDVVIGGGGRLISFLGENLPRLSDFVMERTMTKLQMKNQPPGPREHHNLFKPQEDGEERGHYAHHVARTSLYTQAVLHPWMTAAAVAGVGLLAYAMTRDGEQSMGRMPFRESSSQPGPGDWVTTI